MQLSRELSKDRKAGWNKVAQDYDAYFSSKFKPWIQEVVAAIDTPRLVEGPILDICCGSGGSFRMLETRFPERDIIGIDFSESMLDVAAQKIGSQTILVCQDASDISHFHDTAAFVSSFGLQQMNPLPTLLNWVSTLAEGGRFAVVFWELPLNRHDPFEIGRSLIARKLGKIQPIENLPIASALSEILRESGIKVELDTLRAHPIHHLSRDIFWEAMVKWGPWHSFLLAYGESFIAEVQKEFNFSFDPGELLHQPEARLIIGRKK